ncbi:MAG TPA: hypothetical protein VJ947_02405, partial [Pseudohaliea sp.]|nr:hypothetical protein [Pseudohaliea sp.]
MTPPCRRAFRPDSLSDFPADSQSGLKALLPATINRRHLLAGLGALALCPFTNRARADEDGPRYSALALQTLCDAVNQDATAEAARARMMASIRRIAGQVASAKGFLKTFNGSELRLVVLPEY